jgi:hypothetical protein
MSKLIGLANASFAYCCVAVFVPADLAVEPAEEQLQMVVAIQHVLLIFHNELGFLSCATTLPRKGQWTATFYCPSLPSR